MLFAAGRFDEAAPAYAGLLAQGRDAPYHDYAQYKYAWSLYKQAAYEPAATVFLDILDRELPAGSLQDPDIALAGVARDRRERATESLRVAALSFAALGGGKALSEHFARAPQASRLETLMYAALGSTLLEKERYTDAAGTYAALVERHPGHVRAPEFSAREIEALRRGGFTGPALRAQEAYVARYAPGATYWESRPPDAAVMAQVRQHLDQLARFHHAQAQATAEPAARRAGFLLASSWYRHTLELFPEDAAAVQTRLLHGDALLEGGRLRDAAQQYERAAYDMPAHAGSPVGAIAAVQTWQRLKRDSQGAARTEAQRAAIAAGLRLAETFPSHPQRVPVLMAVAEDQYELGELDAAIASAGLALHADPTAGQRRGALGVIADARYAQKRYADAEVAYQQLVALPAADEEQRRLAVEQLATSVYRQAEAARDCGDLRAAATHFARVARVAPQSGIRKGADYDGASALVALEDWAPAVAALKAFRARHPDHALLPDADKKLALAYEKSGQAAQAAQVLMRIAVRPGEAPEARRTAAWASAGLYDEARLPERARDALMYYVSTWPWPLDPAMQARQRLAELAISLHDDAAARRHWLDQIVAADGAAGAQRSALSKRVAAQASLDIGRIDAAAARGMRIDAPLDRSLARRRAATEAAVRALERAADYGYADITSDATYELAAVYADLGSALLASERPPKLAGEALAQYGLLLEEQAFPFEEKAIEAHEINLARLRNGTWNLAIGRSVAALGELSPGKYGKQEKREASYDELH